MRRKDREVPAEQAYAILDESPYATLAMADHAGIPYCVPLTIARSEDKLYFHCANEGQKLDTLRENPNVCVNFVCQSDPCGFSVRYASAIVHGKAAELTDDAQKREGLRVICERFAAEQMPSFDVYLDRYFPEASVWCIEITSIEGKQRK